jgi:hypothetical protein
MRRPCNWLRRRQGNLLRHEARLHLGCALDDCALIQSRFRSRFKRVKPAAEIVHGVQQQADPEDDEPADETDRAALDQGSAEAKAERPFRCPGDDHNGPA